MLKSWWTLALILVMLLMIVNVIANKYRYKHFNKASRYYSNEEVSGTFLDYTLMEPNELEENRVYPEIVFTRRKELFWSKLATLTYSINVSLCSSIILLMFYGFLSAPIYAEVAFAILLMLNAYLTQRAWKGWRS